MKTRKISGQQVSAFYEPARLLGLGALITASGHISVDLSSFEPEEVENIALAAEEWAKTLRELISVAKNLRDNP